MLINADFCLVMLFRLYYNEIIYRTSMYDARAFHDRRRFIWDKDRSCSLLGKLPGQWV